MKPDTGLASWIRLSLIDGLGPATFRKLLSAFGLPEQILGATHAALSRIVPTDMARRILDDEHTTQLAVTLEWVAHDGNAIVTLADDAYPRLLLEIADPPPLLYVRGRVDLLGAPALAIVGSRNATPQGLANAESFARAFSDAGLAIVSGLALGIDAAAHRGGLAGRGSTIAVLGTGADSLYPLSNRALGEDIAARGLLVSEFPVGTPPVTANFPRRNRLISGLARGCLVVEAAVSSGSLITARQAAEQGREVFAIPGSIHSPVARGCHRLIKQGAKLVESAADVLEELGAPAPGSRAAAPKMSGSQESFLLHMGYDPCSFDALVARSRLTAEVVSAMLLELELEGKIASLPGGRYQRLS
jgi:DNA processing protein